MELPVDAAEREAINVQPLVKWDIDRAVRHLDPYLGGAWDMASDKARTLRRARTKNLLHMVAQRFLERFKSGRPRDVESVAQLYEKAHAAAEFQGYKAADRYVTYLYGNRVLALNGMGNYRFKSALVEQAIEQLRPQTVCEAGCGRVRHLVYFAQRFSDTRFFGFDLSHNAVEFCRQLQLRDSFDPCLPERPGPLSQTEMARVRAISVFQANAADLAGVADNAFELTYTISALEQMHSVLPAALRELHRVTSRYAVFCEPFLDNNDSLQRAYLWSGNYFRLPIRALESYGFRVLDAVPLPTKPTFTDTLVLAEKIQR